MDFFDIIHKLGWLATVVSQTGLIPDPHVNESLLRAGLLVAGGSHVTPNSVKRLVGKK